MQTLIKEVEATVNSRPLTNEEDALSSNIAIKPGHFLTLNPSTGIPDEEQDFKDDDYLPVESSTDKLLKIWKKGQKTLNEFWKIWRDQYLVSLRERMQTQLKSARKVSEEFPKVGDVIQVKDNLPRESWRIGRIVYLVNSSDGQIRSAKVQLCNKRVIGRPLNLLFPLECSASVSDVKDLINKKDNLIDLHELRGKLQAAIIANRKIKRTQKYDA